MHKTMNDKTFVLLSINYIIGFGFIATIIDIVKLGYFGLLIIFASAFIAFVTTLVFARLSNEYKDEYGGSFIYAQKTGYKKFAFFTGWNQWIQVPLFSAAGPLFLERVASVFTSNSTTLWIVRLISVIFFIILILFSTYGFKFSRWAILITASVKWVILILGIGILAYLTIVNNGFKNNFAQAKNSKIDTYLIFSNILFFMFAFGGIETIPNIAKDVKTNNIKKLIIIVFLSIFTFYIIGYVLFLGTDLIKINNNFIGIYRIVFGTASIFIFGTYLLTYNIASTLTSANVYSRIIVALAEEKYLPMQLAKTNKNNEYKNAIWFNTSLIIIAMVLFNILPNIFPQISLFKEVINLGTISFLFQYLLAYITAFILEKQSKIVKIPIYEKILYIFSSLLIISVILIYEFPFLVGVKWATSNTVSIVSYLVFLLLGIGLFWWTLRTKRV
ncbi:amino acid permease [Mycoplasma sp. NEAQ87857]|uniref:APC family permease n=1 Tax=Mycoplasma sp. NEAQ87857 TaxID=2683967 RepID=UPI001318DC3D|nr:APC family permease [Mycoplasma sp. NEAQ87857]QGZ97939.1 amino acid permease [Mycoplasma sp. NEAQ87857]